MRRSGQFESFLDDCVCTSLALGKGDLPQVEERPDQVLLILHLSVVMLALFQQWKSLRIVALADGSHAKKMEQVGQVSFVSSVPGERTALFEQEADLVIVAVRQGKPPQPQQRCRQILCLPCLPGRSIQPQALFTQHFCPLDIAQEKGQPCCPADCLYSHGCRNARSRRQCFLQPGEPFTQRPAHRPE